MGEPSKWVLKIPMEREREEQTKKIESLLSCLAWTGIPLLQCAFYHLDLEDVGVHFSAKSAGRDPSDLERFPLPHAMPPLSMVCIVLEALCSHNASWTGWWQLCGFQAMLLEFRSMLRSGTCNA